jgi:hypothetical protein
MKALRVPYEVACRAQVGVFGARNIGDPLAEHAANLYKNPGEHHFHEEMPNGRSNSYGRGAAELRLARSAVPLQSIPGETRPANGAQSGPEVRA